MSIELQWQWDIYYKYTQKIREEKGLIWGTLLTLNDIIEPLSVDRVDSELEPIIALTALVAPLVAAT